MYITLLQIVLVQLVGSGFPPTISFAINFNKYKILKKQLLQNLQLSSFIYFSKTHDYITNVLKYLTGKNTPCKSFSS